MFIRLATPDDIEGMVKLYQMARAYLKSQNVDQWQGATPNEVTALNDINHGYSYVLEHEGQIIGTAAIILKDEMDYFYQ